MCSSSTLPAEVTPPGLRQRLSHLRLPSPPNVVALLLACLFLLRLPTALVPREFNVDESQLLSEAMKFMVDLRLWKTIESCGPFNSGLISVFLFIGFKPGYVLVHMLESLVLCLQVLVAYMTLRRLASEKTAALGALLMVFLYGTYTHVHYLHYNTESLPALFVMVGFYLFLKWLDEVGTGVMTAQLFTLFLCGLALGAAPWCKIQAIPLSGALGLLVMAAIVRARNILVTPLRRATEFGAFLCGAVLATCIMVVVAAASGATKDLWYSYIRAPLAYVGGLSWTTTLENIARVILVTPVHQLLLVALLGVALLDTAPRKGGLRRRFNVNKWALGGLMVYAAAALIATCRSNNFWPKHAIFFVPPMTYVAAILLSAGASAWLHEREGQMLKAGAFPVLFGPVLVLIATVGLYVAHTTRYIEKTQAMLHLSHMQPDLKQADAKDEAPHSEAALIGPRYWDLPGDGTQRIAAVVASLKQTRPVRSLAVWGWAPGIYVLTGIAPATRDTITQRAIDKGPLQQYFQTRFVADMQANPPDLFIDAIAKGVFLWRTWTENDGYESNPELRKYIDENYALVTELTLVRGAKPVRFFARRQSHSVEE